MKVFCLQRFRDEFLKLHTIKSYRSLEPEIISYFFNKELTQVQSGTRLNNSAETPFIKKRLNGAGGFRFYFLLILKDEDLYLAYVHPKTGPQGSDNITDESKAALQKEVYDSIKTSNLFEVTTNENKLVFTHVKDSLISIPSPTSKIV
ncbi:MAG TPA: hypothetical protein VF602_03400 [Pedobacter sp.]|jgi:hypothetical protein